MEHDEVWAQVHVQCRMCDWRNYLITVSLDETWMKHGHKAMYGVACVIGETIWLPLA